MVKNDRWIEQMAREYRLIDPFSPEQVKLAVDGSPVASWGLSSFGYDVRSAGEWKLFTNVYGGGVIDPLRLDEGCFHHVSVAPDASGKYGSIIIPPNSYALTHSIEHLKIPENIICICLGKSTWARCGIHVNVTPLEPGWEGQITIEISNSTPLPVRIQAGCGIAQILFLEGERPSETYAERNGKYQHQRGVVFAKL